MEYLTDIYIEESNQHTIPNILKKNISIYMVLP